MKNYMGIWCVLMLLAGCTAQYTDKFMPITDEQAVLGWKSDIRFFEKGNRSARASAKIYEEIYSFDDDEEKLELYVGKYARPHFWERNRSEIQIEEALSHVPMISNAKKISYLESYRTSKTVKLLLTIDSQECAAFIDRLQLSTIYPPPSEYRTFILGIYCSFQGRKIADLVIDRLRNAYTFKDELYDGAGL